MSEGCHEGGTGCEGCGGCVQCANCNNCPCTNVVSLPVQVQVQGHVVQVVHQQQLQQQQQQQLQQQLQQQQQQQQHEDTNNSNSNIIHNNLTSTHNSNNINDHNIITPSPEESPTKLIVNYIPEVMNQNTMYSLFATMGKLESCKLISNRGYGFVEYCHSEDAAKARKAFDGLPMQNKTLKVSYALLRPECKPPGKPEADWNLYVCNLPDDMSLHSLHQLFQSFGRIINSRVAAGIAFILYQQQADAERAIQHMNGLIPEGFVNPLTVKYANKSNPNKSRHHGSGYDQRGLVPKAYAWYGPSVPSVHEHSSAAGWSIYVYNIASEVEELALWQLFGPYGAVVSVRIIIDHQTSRSKGFGFVTMRNYEQAAVAIQALNGYVLMGQPLSVSFKTQKR